MASAPEAHADTGVWAPALAPTSNDTYAAGELGISMGTVNGSTRRGPDSFIVSHELNRVHTPPIPEAITEPSRSPSISGEPASAHASLAAITAYCAEGSIRRIWGRANTSSGLTRSSPANVTGRSCSSTQSCCMVATPEVPARAASHVEATSPPKGEVAPSPVTTIDTSLLISKLLRVEKARSLGCGFPANAEGGNLRL